MWVIGMVLLCERHCVPLCPWWPPVPPNPRALPPLHVLPVCPPVLLLFFFFSCSRSPLLPRALRVPPALLRATTVPLPCAPSLACLPSHSASRCRPCLYVCPPCLSRAVTHVCHPRALPLPLPVAPTLFPGSSPTLVLPRSPSLTPPWLPCALCGGGGYLWTGLWPCPRTGMAVGFLRTMSLRMCQRNTERTSVRRLSNSLRCICTVEPSRIDQLRTSDDQMDESRAEGIRQQNLAASDVAFSIKEKKDKVLTSIVEAQQITRTLSNLAYIKWENFQASKSARKALTMENLKVKEEIEEAFKRKNNDDRNSTPISTMEVNRKVDMLIKAMEDLVFRENTKTPKNGPATHDARSGPRKGRDGDRRHTRNKSPVAHSRKKQKSGRSNTPTSTKSSKSTRSTASMKSAGDKRRRSTENKNKTNKKQRRRADQKNGGATNAKH